MDIEHTIIVILREAAFRHFIDRPLSAPNEIVRFLRASQRYV
jgi:hypothetical protein